MGLSRRRTAGGTLARRRAPDLPAHAAARANDCCKASASLPPLPSVLSAPPWAAALTASRKCCQFRIEAGGGGGSSGGGGGSGGGRRPPRGCAVVGCLIHAEVGVGAVAAGWVTERASAIRVNDSLGLRALRPSPDLDRNAVRWTRGRVGTGARLYNLPRPHAGPNRRGCGAVQAIKRSRNPLLQSPLLAQPFAPISRRTEQYAGRPDPDQGGASRCGLRASCSAHKRRLCASEH